MREAARAKVILVPMDVSGGAHGFQEHSDVRLVGDVHNALQFDSSDSLADDGENVGLCRQG